MAPEVIRANPALAKLARVLAIFYLPPPAAGGTSDGFPVAVDTVPLLEASRVFVLVHPVREQTKEDGERLLGLTSHAVRKLLTPQRVPGKPANDPRPPPFQVIPLHEVLRAVRAYPADWPGRTSEMNEAKESEILRRAARCETGDVMVLWLPTHGTRLPPQSHDEFAAVGLPDPEEILEARDDGEVV